MSVANIKLIGAPDMKVRKFLRYEMEKTHTPAAASMPTSAPKSAFLSARFPPHQYPKLKEPKMTPIRLVQTMVDVPRYGAIIRDPSSSRIITTAPDTKAIISKMYFITLEN